MTSAVNWIRFRITRAAQLTFECGVLRTAKVPAGEVVGTRTCIEDDEPRIGGGDSDDFVRRNER